MPVITHTPRPSVTGEGDDMFCFISRWFPPLRGFFQIGTPLSRSMRPEREVVPFSDVQEDAIVPDDGRGAGPGGKGKSARRCFRSSTT